MFLKCEWHNEARYTRVLRAEVARTRYVDALNLIYLADVPCGIALHDLRLVYDCCFDCDFEFQSFWTLLELYLSRRSEHQS